MTAFGKAKMSEGRKVNVLTFLLYPDSYLLVSLFCQYIYLYIFYATGVFSSQ